MDLAIVRPARRGAVVPGNTRTRRTLREQGQVLAIFAAATILFVGILAIVIDVSWYWANSLRVQRAADAAALAGVVWLPGNVSSAQQAAYNEASKDGYTAGVGGVTITASPGLDGSLGWRSEPARRDGQRVRQHVLHAPVRDQLDQRDAQLQGALRPAGAHGQPAELLRRLRQGAVPRVRRIRLDGADDHGRSQPRHGVRHRDLDHAPVRLLGHEHAVRHHQGGQQDTDLEQLRVQYPQWGDRGRHPGRHDGQDLGQHLPDLGRALVEQRHRTTARRRATTNLTTTATSYGLGGATDTWGHTLEPADRPQ